MAAWCRGKKKAHDTTEKGRTNAGSMGSGFWPWLVIQKIERGHKCVDTVSALD